MVFAYLTGRAGPSGFGSRTTAAEVAEKYKYRIPGNVYIVTGCSSGIGQETVLQLVKRGATVVMANRNQEKSQRAVQAIKSEVPDAKLHEITLELGSMASICSFVEEFHKLNLGGLKGLVNNAGVMACPLAYTTDGFEMQFGTNHLGHYLLTNLLIEDLKKGAPSRVVNLSSSAHSMAYRPEGIRFDDLDGKKSYTQWGAYGQSKLANLVHARELDRRFKEKGLNASAFSVHPGVIRTELGRHITNPLFEIIGGPLMKVLGKTIPQGAATTMYALLSPDLDTPDAGGKYFADANVCTPLHPSLEDKNGDPQALAKRLWEVSAELTKSDMP